MKYAVIAISGSQFKVQEDDVLDVDHLESKPGDKKSIDSVLLIVDDKKTTIGDPTIKKASVDYEIVKNYQGPKIRVYKYKAKSRYRKTQGFRAQLTTIKILKINS